MTPGGATLTIALSAQAQRIQDVLGPTYRVVEFADSTHTAAEAARAIGCDLGQIAKSLVFLTRASGRAVLIVASGANRIDTKKIAAIVGERVRAADAEFIRQSCGFEPGGVSPVGFKTPPIAILDIDLKKFPTLWAAAGSANAVFELTPAQLASLTGAAFADVAKKE